MDVVVTVPDTATDDEVAAYMREIAEDVAHGWRAGKKCGGYVWQIEGDRGGTHE